MEEKRVSSFVELTEEDIRLIRGYLAVPEKPGNQLLTAEAMFRLAEDYGTGKNGKNQNEEQAFYWYAQAALLGYPDALDSLAKCLSDGNGIAQDDAAAAYWFAKMAKWGSSRSQNNLGWAYANGVGVPQDDEQAAYWYRQAAEQGRAVAQENLGQCYGAGWGVPQDEVQAAYWYSRAAEQGRVGAQFLIGAFYELGRGVTKVMKKRLIGIDRQQSKVMQWRRAAWAFAMRKAGAFSVMKRRPYTGIGRRQSRAVPLPSLILAFVMNLAKA